MTLLDSITAAAVAGGGVAAAGVRSPYPISINAKAILSNLTPVSAHPTAAASALTPATGWSITDADSALADAVSDLAGALSAHFRDRASLSEASFLRLLSAFFRRAAASLGLPPGDSDAYSDVVATASNLGAALGRDAAAALVAQCCVVLDLRELFETLIARRYVGRLGLNKLVEQLVAASKTQMLCFLVKHAAADLQSSELLAVLQYFLSPPSEAAYADMQLVKKNWGKAALLAGEKYARKEGIRKKESTLAREAALLLMMAHDEFSAPDTCLHYLFGSAEIDQLVFASAVARLDGSEVLGLLSYLVKWLGKYRRFPQARPSSSASRSLGLEECESVPSVEVIVRALGVLLDQHFKHLVFNHEIGGELHAADEVIRSLVSEADLCTQLASVIEQLQSDSIAQ